MKLSPWFDVSTPPARVGVYKRQHPLFYGRDAYQHWSGKGWGCVARTVQQAMRWRNIVSNHQNGKWRGVLR